MSTINDSDQFLVQRGTTSHKQSAVDLMSTIQDTDLMLIQRGTDSYKVTCLDVKDQLGGGGAKPPSVDGATLTGTGPKFSGETYTTSLTNYDPGNPPATQTMKARVVGSLQVVGETSAITKVALGPDQVGIYASSNLDNAPNFQTYLDKGDTTTSWNTNWPSVTYTQTGGTGGTIGFWYSDDAVTWTRDSSTTWGTSPLGGGGTGTTAKRYMAFNADVTGVADGTDVGYVAIPDMTGLTVVSVSAGVTLQKPDSGSGDWAAVVGAPQNKDRTPYLFGDGASGTKGKMYFTGMTVGDAITWWGYSTAGGTRPCAGDVSQSSVNIPTDPNNPGPVTVNVTAASGYFLIDFNGNSETHACYSITPGPGGVFPVLTLADRKDLDNGLFQPGDVVKKAVSSGVELALVDQAGYGWYDETEALQSTGTASNIVSQNFFNSDLNDTNKQGNKGFYFNDENNFIEFTYSGATVGETITLVVGKASSAGDTTVTKLQIVGNVNEAGTFDDLIPVSLAGKNTLPKFAINLTATGTTGTIKITLLQNDSGSVANLYWHYWTGGSSEVTVVSIDQSSPKMTVTGGDWSVGDKVKNSVARAPEITPTTDSIVDFTSQSIDYSSRVTLAGPGAFHPAGNGPDKIFDGDPNTFCAVESSASPASEDVEIVFDATGLGIDTTGNNIIARSAGGWTFKCTGSLGTADKAISSDPAGTSLPAVGILQEIRVKGNGANWMYLKEGDTYYVDNTPSNVLTFASDKDLAQFDASDDVAQDSGHTPQSSAITNAAAQTVSKVRGFYSSTLPTNLTEAMSGTEFDMTLAGTNVIDNSHYLSLVCDDDCPTSGQVFNSDYGAIFDMKWNTGSGNFDKDGTKLDNSDQPPSGPPATTDIVFSNGGTTGFIVNTQAAYTVLSTTMNSTLPRVADSALSNQNVLTLTDDTDLKNFRVNDVVQRLSSNSPVYFAVNDPDGPPGAGSSFTIYDTCSLDMTSTAVQSVGVDQNRPAGYSLKSLIFDLLVETGDITVGADTTGWTVASSLDGKTWVSEGVIDPGSGTSMRATMTNQPTARYIALGAAGMSNDWNGVDAFTVAMNQAIVDTWASGEYPGSDLPTTQDVKLLAINTQTNVMTVDGGTWTVGNTVTGPFCTPATGTVGSTDSTAKTMKLATSDESGTKRWIVNQNKTVVGPKGPANKTTAYLTWNGTAVNGLQVNDPGYAAAPAGLQLTFTDPSPTGQTWDQELPAGTSIATRVVVTNTEGSDDTNWTTAVTPRFLHEGDDFNAAFAEEAVRFMSHQNRAAVHQGEVAMAEREKLKEDLRAAGASPPAIDEVLGGTSK